MSIEHIEKQLEAIDGKVDKTHTMVTTLHERSVQHEKRMDRSDRRAGFIGAITGAVAGFLRSFVAGD